MSERKEISWQLWEKCQDYEHRERSPHYGDGEEQHFNNRLNHDEIMSEMMGLEWEGEEISSVAGKSVIEIGAGPWGLTLRVKGASLLYAVEPAKFPANILGRYESRGVKFINEPAELVTLKSLGLTEKFDEVWLSNCLQHTQSPQHILQNMLDLGKTIRVFEWVDYPPHEGHPWLITKNLIESELLSGADCEVGIQRKLNIRCNPGPKTFIGNAYWGIFKVRE